MSVVKILYAGGGICCDVKPQSSVYLAIRSEDFTFYTDNKLSKTFTKAIITKLQVSFYLRVLLKAFMDYRVSAGGAILLIGT